MSDFKCDTQRLADDGKKIVNIVNSYQKNINDFFQELQSLTANKAWNGDDAELYVSLISTDKPEFVDYGNGLKELGEEMMDFADSLDRKVVTTERDFSSNY